ncbi:MAG: 3'-5' exonuclease [Candidatus Omnitrophota bacterium]|nr:3'-5' exonuclease [Candidatus Omnitrophota bacterium]
MPLKHYTGSIHLIDSDAKMREAARSLSREKVLGFDTETRPAFKKGESYSPSLIQLAAADDVYIFQIGRINSHKSLAGILADRFVLKTGIGVSEDIKKLQQIVPFEPSGFIGLAGMAAKAGIKNAGLRGLAALLFGFRISKQTQCSRWDAPTLTRAQIVYAATDAWICREIYFALLERKGSERK